MKIVKILLVTIVLTGMVGGLTSWQYAEQPYNEAEYALEASNDASERSVKAGKTRRTEALQDDLSAELPHEIKARVVRGAWIPSSRFNKLSASQKKVIEAYNAWLESDYSKMDDKRKTVMKEILANVRTFKGLKNVINAFN